MRKIVSLGTVAFAATLGVFVGNKLRGEAMAVVVGVVCGALASIPMSVMILILTRQLSARTRSIDSTRPQQQGVYPPVFVIQGDNQGRRDQFFSPWNPPGMQDQPMRHSFTVVGDEDWED